MGEGRGLRPCTLLGGRGRRFLAFRRVWREGQDAPAGRVVLLWLALFFSGVAGLACAVVPGGPPSNVLGNRGTRCTSGGVAPPAPCLGDGGGCFGLRPPSAGGLAWPAPLSQVAHPPTLLETGGHAVPPAGAAPPAPCLGNGGFVLACALLQRGDWLGLRRCPRWPTLQRYWKQGDSPCTPGGGAAPCTPLGGSRELALAGRMLPNLPPAPRLGRRQALGSSVIPTRRFRSVG